MEVVEEEYEDNGFGTKLCIITAILGVIIWYAGRQPPNHECPDGKCPVPNQPEPDRKPLLPILPKPKPR